MGTNNNTYREKVKYAMVNLDLILKQARLIEAQQML
jgi:hypothetical protein